MPNPIKTADRAEPRAVEASLEMNGVRVSIRASISGSGSRSSHALSSDEFASSQLQGLASGLQAVTDELLPRALQEFDAALTRQETKWLLAQEANASL